MDSDINMNENRLESERLYKYLFVIMRPNIKKKLEELKCIGGNIK